MVVPLIVLAMGERVTMWIATYLKKNIPKGIPYDKCNV